MYKYLYRLNASPLHEADFVQVSDYMRFKVLLWHKRLRHINFRTLHIMSRKGIVKDLPKLPRVDIICETCQQGKQS